MLPQISFCSGFYSNIGERVRSKDIVVNDRWMKNVRFNDGRLEEFVQLS